MTSHTWTGWLTWIGICTVIWALAFIVAEVYVQHHSVHHPYVSLTRAPHSIPFFNDLLGVISSIFARCVYTRQAVEIDLCVC